MRALRRYLRTAPYDLVHCHLDNDTEIALRAVTGFGIPVVRSSYEGMGFSPTCRHRGFLQKCRAVIEPSRMALENDARILGADSGRLFVVNTAIDGERFNPERQFPDMRASRGFSQDDFLLGIVARIQGHRHYEDLFAAFAKFAAEVPGAHLVVVGRGTRQEQLAFRPVRELDLENRVHFTGYLTADEYVGMLAAFDAGVFLTPGTDGTCRAVREIMAMGKPMITSNRGMLAEIVTHERNGIVTDGSPNNCSRPCGSSSQAGSAFSLMEGTQGKPLVRPSASNNTAKPSWRYTDAFWRNGPGFRKVPSINALW